MKQFRALMSVLSNIEQCLKLANVQTGCCPKCKLENGQEQAFTGPPAWIGQQAVMDYLQISRSTFFRLKKDGFLSAHKIGGRDYFLLTELELAFRESVRKGRI